MNRVLGARKREIVGLVALVIATLFVAGACAGPGAPLGPGNSGEGVSTLGGATSGVAFFDTLVISKAGSGYTLVASAPGFGSVASAPFRVFGAIGATARAQ